MKPPAINPQLTLLPQQQQGGLMGLLSNPMFTAGMGLLSAGYDSRINPYSAALQGMSSAQQTRWIEDKRKREKEMEAARQNWLGAQTRYYDARSQPQQMPPPERKYEEDAAGRKRYLDTGEYVFPDVEIPEPKRDVEKVYGQEKNLRTELNSLTKDFRQQEEAMGRIIASATDPSAAGDLALIFNYMKMLDPGSTVREGEFANAENSAGVGAQVRSIYNRLLNGQRLAPEQRDDFLSRAGMIYQDASTGYQRRASQFENLARRYEVDPSRVVLAKPRFSEKDFAFEPSKGDGEESFTSPGGISYKVRPK